MFFTCAIFHSLGRFVFLSIHFLLLLLFCCHSLKSFFFVAHSLCDEWLFMINDIFYSTKYWEKEKLKIMNERNSSKRLHLALHSWANNLTSMANFRFMKNAHSVPCFFFPFHFKLTRLQWTRKKERELIAHECLFTMLKIFGTWFECSMLKRKFMVIRWRFLHFLQQKGNDFFFVAIFYLSGLSILVETIHNT